MSLNLLTMGGLDPPTQPAFALSRFGKARRGARVRRSFQRRRICAANKLAVAAKYFITRADARALGGRLKAGHGEI